METFINPYTDYGFKKLFGEEKNKHLLISFLNDLLGGEEHVSDLVFQNTEHLPDGGPEQRKAIFDIYCTNPNGEHFIVELQKAKQNYFKDRTVFYSTFPIQQQAKKGDWNFNLKAVYCIGILDFVFSDDKKGQDVIHTVQLKDQHHQVFYDKLKFIYVEMPHFNKSLEQLENHCDRWLYFIKNLNDLDEIPELFRDDIIYQGFEVARISAFNKQERASYESSLKVYRDIFSVMTSAKQEGVDEGIAIGKSEGIAIGKSEAIQSMASTMIAAGMSDEQIVTVTKLSSAEVATLRAKLAR